MPWKQVTFAQQFDPNQIEATKSATMSPDNVFTVLHFGLLGQTGTARFSQRYTPRQASLDDTQCSFMTTGLPIVVIELQSELCRV